MLEDCFLILHVLTGNLPDLGRPVDHLLFHTLGSFVTGPTSLEGDAAAAGVGGEADGVGVADLGIDVFDCDAQDLRDVHRHGDAAAADVR